MTTSTEYGAIEFVGLPLRAEKFTLVRATVHSVVLAGALASAVGVTTDEAASRAIAALGDVEQSVREIVAKRSGRAA